MLAQSLEFGRKRGLLESNPAKDTQRPKSRKTKPYSPTSVDVRAVLAVAEDRDPEMADIARLLVSTGMRRGELLALLWSDVDTEGRELSVSSAVVALRRTPAGGFWRAELESAAASSHILLRVTSHSWVAELAIGKLQLCHAPRGREM